MKEPTMPVQIYLDGKKVFNGELLQNGPGLAVCSANANFLQYEADTALVEAKIPMEILRDNQIIGEGELYQSGGYCCLSPADQDLHLMDPEAIAELFLEKFGQTAKLEIKYCH